MSFSRVINGRAASESPRGGKVSFLVHVEIASVCAAFRDNGTCGKADPEYDSINGDVMAGFYDVYVLAPARTTDAVERFLKRYVPHREPSANEYPVPQFADEPTTVFFEAMELVAYCVEHPDVAHGIYWRSLDDCDPFHAMAFFFPYGGMVLGLSVVANPVRWLGDLFSMTGSEIGYWAFEEPPPESILEFKDLAARMANRESE